MNAIQKFIEAEHKYLDLNEISYQEYEKIIAPLRDVESVVRCKDCKNVKWADVNDETVFCRLQGMAHSWDFFCADGERKI